MFSVAGKDGESVEKNPRDCEAEASLWFAKSSIPYSVFTAYTQIGDNFGDKSNSWGRISKMSAYRLDQPGKNLSGFWGWVKAKTTIKVL